MPMSHVLLSPVYRQRVDMERVASEVNRRLLPNNMIQTLATGAECESWAATAAKFSISADVTNYKVGVQGVKFTSAGATDSGYVYLDPLPQADPVPTHPAQAICMWLYVDVGARLTYSQVIMYTASGLQTYWTKTTTSTMADGWNFVRFQLGSTSPIASWDNGIYRLTFCFSSSDAINITLGHCYLECPRKARSVIISDGAYETFYTEAWPQFQRRGWPTTWGINPGSWGATAIKNTMTLAQFETAMAADVAGDEVSFHSWDRDLMESLSAADVRTDTYNCIRYVQAHWPDRYVPWRSAWTANHCDNHAAVQDVLLCYATPAQSTGGGVMWPPDGSPQVRAYNSRWDIPRNGIMSTVDLAEIESQMRYTHCTFFQFFHGISTGVDAGNDATPAKFADWLALMDALVASGDLEFTTMGALLQEIGIYYRPAWHTLPVFEVPAGDGSHSSFIMK